MHKINPSDVESLSHCPRRVWYEYHPPAGMESVEPAAFDALIIRLGQEHEQIVKQRLEKTRTIMQARDDIHTRKLMEDGTEIIYQGYLTDEGNNLVGIPDFLIRQEDGRYQAADAKLARDVDDEIAIQLGFYRRLLNNDLPALAFLGTGEVKEVGDETNPDVNEYITEIRSVLEDKQAPLVRYSESKCRPCPYYGACYPAFKDKEELTLVYGIDSRSAPGLEKNGITTISELAGSDPATIPDIPYMKGLEKKQRGVLQAKAWKTGEMYKIKDIALPGGTWVHFDIEVNPLTPHCQDHVYLWGFLKPGYQFNDFDYVWTDHHDDDRAGWDAFLTKIEGYRSAWPDLRIVHYSNYERTKIKEYAARYTVKQTRRMENMGQSETTFEIIARAWLDTMVWTKKHKKNIVGRFEADVFPKIGYIQIDKVTPQNMLAVLKAIEARGALDVAKRMCQHCTAIFDYAIVGGLCEGNPALGRSKLIKSYKVQHRPRMSDEQLPLFLNELDGYSGSRLVQLAMKLLILTFVRPGEFSHNSMQFTEAWEK